MKSVIIYSTLICPYCVRAKELLTSQNIPYEEVRVDDDPIKRAEMERLSGRRTVPQIFIGSKHVGGFADLQKLYERDELKHWLDDRIH